MARSPDIERLIFRRLLRSLPEAAPLLVSSALNNGKLDSMPDQSLKDQAEKIKEFESEARKGAQK